jgi:hypothetical protein
MRELRTSFHESLRVRSTCSNVRRCDDGNWEVAAMRLKGLAASFQVWPLIAWPIRHWMGRRAIRWFCASYRPLWMNFRWVDPGYVPESIGVWAMVRVLA